MDALTFSQTLHHSPFARSWFLVIPNFLDSEKAYVDLLHELVFSCVDWIVCDSYNIWINESAKNDWFFWIMCPIAWLYTSINELIQEIKVWYAPTPDMTVLVSLIDVSFSQQFTRNVIVSHTNDFLTNFPCRVWQEHIYECNSHHVIL